MTGDGVRELALLRVKAALWSPSSKRSVLQAEPVTRAGHAMEIWQLLPHSVAAGVGGRWECRRSGVGSSGTAEAG